ncbi:hypothetical protein BDF22DRAFT_670182 [Syncephalis plumigaleata]|nr:hypothetical protein BDF22DRAFT_670182 [Syncephalis plumigaleata]
MAATTATVTSSSEVVNVLQLLRQRRDNRKKELECDDFMAASGVTLPTDGSDGGKHSADESAQRVREMLEASERIGTVRKSNMFAEEMTETEIDIIQQRVALQQKQFAEFERRELRRKADKVRQTFDYITDDEVAFALKQLDNDEDELILNLSQPMYLNMIRKELAAKSPKAQQAKPENNMTREERQKYEQLLRKRTTTMKKNVTDETRRKYQKVGRLRLEDALKQMRENPDAAMEGWSEARKKAWKAIDKNPNSYYYRFNAPNEPQRTGPWTQYEQKLFHQRLKEMGANGQWGVFSIAIPGRVGYQCSNYYRQLVETNKIQDPNYVLDDKGKAHYLFSTKDGRKTFRTHCKHRRDGSSYDERKPRSRRSTANQDDSDEENREYPPDKLTDTEANQPAVKSRATVKASKTKNTSNSTSNSNSNTTTATTAAASSTKRPRRRQSTRRDSDDGYGSTNDSDSDWMYGRERDDDFSSDYRSSSSSSRAMNYGTTKRARAMASRRAGGSATATYSSNSTSTDNTSLSSHVGDPSSNTAHHDTSDPMLSDIVTDIAISGGGGGGRVANCGVNPLPGYIDPITLEEVVKPAISPHGHVMGYDNWVRCLTRSEPRNTCPITKQPLSKRDLVVLTMDNIDEYRDKMVSM